MATVKDSFWLLNLNACSYETNLECPVATTLVAEGLSAALVSFCDTTEGFIGFMINCFGASGAVSSQFQVLLHLQTSSPIRFSIDELETRIFDQAHWPMDDFPDELMWQEYDWNRLSYRCWESLKSFAESMAHKYDSSAYTVAHWKEETVDDVKPNTP